MASKVMKRENLVISYEKYQQNGQDKNAWRNIGELITFQHDDGTTSQIVKLWHLPGHTINVFEKRDIQQEGQGQKPAQPAPQPKKLEPIYEEPTEEISIEDIPF